jgi:hypothetical protein
LSDRERTRASPKVIVSKCCLARRRLKLGLRRLNYAGHGCQPDGADCSVALATHHALPNATDLIDIRNC